MTMRHHFPLSFGFVSTMRGMPWGGSEDLWSQAALEARRRGHRVKASVLHWPSRPAPLDELLDRGVELAFRPRHRRYLDRALQKGLKLASPGALEFPHRHWLKHSNLDLVVISQGGPWDGVPWMLACRDLGLPYCCVIQANSELWWPLDEHWSAARTAYGGARGAFFVSRSNLALMERQLAMNLPNADVISNPCRVDRSSYLAWPQTDGSLRLACVGRLCPQAKGQDVLFQVLAQEKWRRRNIVLNVYGSGPSESSLRSLALFLRLPRTFFHGQVSDVRSIWADNHALVLPSRYEGLPLTIVEAMLCGRPVITTNVAGNAEVVSDEETSFIASACTVPLLDQAMENAWARRHEWEIIGRRAREAALAFTPIDPIGDFVGKLLSIVGAPLRAASPLEPQLIEPPCSVSPVARSLP